MKLIGVGVGPGDPELVTVKALRLLRSADAVAVPVLPGAGPGRAETVVRAHLGAGAPLHRLAFELSDRTGRSPARRAAWDAAAEQVAALLRGSCPVVAFATIGDPAVYSTFSYLAASVRAILPGVTVELTPGVTAMQDLACRTATPLVEGRERLTLLPLSAGLDGLRAALRTADTVVAYKGGERLAEALAAVREAGRLGAAVYGAALGLPGERICPAAELGGEPGPYLATLLVPPAQRSRGGRL